MSSSKPIRRPLKKLEYSSKVGTREKDSMGLEDDFLNTPVQPSPRKARLVIKPRPVLTKASPGFDLDDFFSPASMKSSSPRKSIRLPEQLKHEYPKVGELFQSASETKLKAPRKKIEKLEDVLTKEQLKLPLYNISKMHPDVRPSVSDAIELLADLRRRQNAEADALQERINAMLALPLLSEEEEEYEEGSGRRRRARRKTRK